MYKHALLAYDGSPAAAAGLSFCRRLAQVTGCEVTIAHIRDPHRKAREESIVDRAPVEADATRGWLEALCREGFEEGSPATPMIVDDGAPGRTIVELAEREDADLVIVGRSGSHSLGRFLLGNTAERVIRHAPSSVAVFPPEEAQTASPPRVMAAYDGSDPSKQALLVAGGLASALSAGLLIVHAVDYRVPFSGPAPEGARELMRTQGEELLREAEAGVSAPLDFVESALCDGDPRAALLRAAGEHRPLLLVVGDRGAGGFPGLRLGSTTDELVRSAEPPVLVVREVGSR